MSGEPSIVEKLSAEFRRSVMASGMRFGGELSIILRDGGALETIERIKGEFLDKRQLSDAELKNHLHSMVPSESMEISREQEDEIGALGMIVSSWDALLAFLQGAAFGYERGTMRAKPAKFPKKEKPG